VVREVDLAPRIASRGEEQLRAAEGSGQLLRIELEPVSGEVDERRARIRTRRLELLE
jgi:hypothetical protein